MAAEGRIISLLPGILLMEFVLGFDGTVNEQLVEYISLQVQILELMTTSASLCVYGINVCGMNVLCFLDLILKACLSDGCPWSQLLSLRKHWVN